MTLSSWSLVATAFLSFAAAPIARRAEPTDGEVRAKRHLRGALRTAHRDLPLASARRSFLPLDQFIAQAVRRLLQRQSPIVEHV